MNTPRILVIGGGLAGMAAAVALESAGAGVTLLEARSSLGGRAGSFTDPTTGQTLDNCQHVLLGCCTNLIDLYKRLGVLDRIAWERTIRFRDARGREHGLRGMRGLPAPLNLSASMAVFRALSVRQRARLVKAMLAMLRTDRESVEQLSFGDWLDQHHQDEELIRRFYDVIVISGLNEQTRAASVKYAIQIFQDAMMANSGGYVMGLPSCPLGELYAKVPCADVRTGERVAELRFEGRRITGAALTDGDVISADAVILATGFHAAQRFLAERDPRLSQAIQLQTVPILGAHLWFDRPILRNSHAALMTGPLQWLFRKNADGSAVHGVISAARDWLDIPRDSALAKFQSQVRTAFPEAGDAKLLRGVTVIEKRATFAPLPGSDAFRPDQRPPANGVENLYLAGDYTRTGWPSTMEGAARGGYLAAEAVAERFTLSQRRFLVPDLPIQWPARLLGLT